MGCGLRHAQRPKRYGYSTARYAVKRMPVTGVSKSHDVKNGGGRERSTRVESIDV